MFQLLLGVATHRRNATADAGQVEFDMTFMDARHGEFVDPQCRPDRASSPRQHEQQDQAETSTVALE